MSRRGVLLFAAMSVIWGISYLFIRVAVSELTPATLVFFRTALSAAILLPVAFPRGGLRAFRGRWQALVVFSAVEVGIPWFCLSSAEQQISSSLAGLLVSAVPLAATLIAPVLGTRDRMGSANIVGLGIGIAGVAAIVGLDLRATSWVALVEIAVVVVCYALGPVVLSRYLGTLPAVSVTAYSLALCAVVYAPIAALQWPGSVPSLEVLGSVAVLSVICTALAFLLFFALIAEIGPVRATVITYVNPAVAAVAGVLVLHERFTLGMGVGFVLVLIGSALATRRVRRSEQLVVEPVAEP